MLRILQGVALCMVSGLALAAGPDLHTMRIQSESNPHALVAKVRAALDAGDYANDPAGEREALWWMGHSGINAADEAAVTEAVARLKSLGSVGHDSLAESYADFLTADQRIVHGDAGGVSDALRGADRQLDSPDPARRALAKFQLCDAYDMAFQFARSQPLCQQADAAFGALHDDWDQAQAKNDVGNNFFGMQKYAEAQRFYEDAMALYRKYGDHSRTLEVGDNLAQVYLTQGKPEAALALSQASLADEKTVGRVSDAMISQYDIARALEAMGKRRQALALIAKTVEGARKAKLGSLLPDILEQQSQMAERNGNLKLAVSAEREALKASRMHWSDSLRSQQAELAARYATREKELRIRELERNNQIKNLKLKAADATAERNAMRIRREHGILIAVAVAGLSLVVAVVSLLLLLRGQRRHTRDLQRQAFEDPLTGVDNRRGFFRKADHLLARQDKDQSPLHALLLFDFDYFKQINDRGGHPFGDIVLNVSLHRIRDVVAGRGDLARLGGEEFILLCPRIGGEGALRLAEEIRAAVSELSFPQAPDDLDVTISIGVALFDGNRCHDVGSWLRAADNAMYEAKRHGRDQVVVAQAVHALLAQAETGPQPAV